MAMYKIIYMKADFEPWWQFDGWEEHIVSVQQYENEKQFNLAFAHIIEDFRQKYDYEACKENRYFAFWSEDESEFCEACDEDAQIYHGLIVMTPNPIAR
jgi:hypothetical protein